MPVIPDRVVSGPTSSIVDAFSSLKTFSPVPSVVPATEDPDLEAHGMA